MSLQSQQIGDQARLILQTAGLGYLKTQVYKGVIPQGSDPDSPIGVGSLGNAIFSNLEIQGGSYLDENDNTITYPSLTIETVLFQVEMQKNIIYTPIQGRNVTVKEYIADKDYMIRINGVLTGSNKVYPRDQVAALIQILKAPVALTVNSWYLQQFDIYNLVIDNYQVPQEKGWYSMQPFSISALSDNPIELTLK